MEINLKDNYGNDIKVGYVVVLGTSGSKLRKAIVSSVRRLESTSKIIVSFKTVGFEYQRKNIILGNTKRGTYNDTLPEVMVIGTDIEKCFPECFVHIKLVTKFVLKK